MPVYEFACDKCHHRHEKFLRIDATPPKKCPDCGAKDYRRLFSEPAGIVRGNPKTVGAAAEENAKRVGKEKLAEMAMADKARFKGGVSKLPKGATPNTTKPATPPWRDGTMGSGVLEKPLDLSKVKNVKRYVETGKMD